MTFQERAENILDFFKNYLPQIPIPPSGGDLKGVIINQIEEAIQHEHDRIRIEHAKALVISFEEGFATAQEKAANLCEKYTGRIIQDGKFFGGLEMAKAIRAIRMEEK